MPRNCNATEGNGRRRAGKVRLKCRESAENWGGPRKTLEQSERLHERRNKIKQHLIALGKLYLSARFVLEEKGFL